MKKVTLICTDESSGLETVAIRGVLEYFGYIVSTHWIGNKKQFLELIQGKQPVDDIVVLAAHGTEGAYFLPNEEQVTFEELQVHLPQKIIISLGCETYGAADYFIKGKCKICIAPKGSPEGNDAAFFTVKFFWQLAQGKDVRDAFKIAAKDMPKGSEFMMI